MEAAVSTDRDMERTGPLGLDPRAIEEEIARIRDRESNPFIAGTRTNLFTLVIMLAGAEERESAAGAKEPAAQGGAPDAGARAAAAARVEQALMYVLGRRPARIITIEPGEGPRTTVTAGGRCSPDMRNRGVCFEEIRIYCGSDGLGARPAAWSPLLIKDLPVYAWWSGFLSSYPKELSEAAELLDKVMVDASYYPSARGNPYEALAVMAREKDRARATAFVDLGWRRMGSLRAQTARMFDAPGTRERLDAVSGVSLSGGTPTDGAEYFLWLAARLGWKPERLDSDSARFTDAAGRRVDAAHQGGRPTEGLRVSFSFSDGGGELAMTCQGNGCVAMGEETGVYRQLSDGEALLTELDSLAQDPLFADVLDLAGAWPRRLSGAAESRASPASGTPRPGAGSVRR